MSDLQWKSQNVTTFLKFVLQLSRVGTYLWKVVYMETLFALHFAFNLIYKFVCHIFYRPQLWNHPVGSWTQGSSDGSYRCRRSGRYLLTSWKTRISYISSDGSYRCRRSGRYLLTSWKTRISYISSDGSCRCRRSGRYLLTNCKTKTIDITLNNLVKVSSAWEVFFPIFLTLMYRKCDVSSETACNRSTM